MTQTPERRTQSTSNVGVIKRKLKLSKITKGALQYVELAPDGSGKVLDYNHADALFGSIYLRQKQVATMREGWPLTIELTLTIP